MGVESDSDLSDFFVIDDFAITAKYTAIGKTAKTIKGIFDNPQVSINASDMLDVTIPSPKFVCRTVDVPNAAEGDAMVINSTSYYVRVVLNDGTGVSTLIMEKA